MARIEFVDLAHSYGESKSEVSAWALRPMTITWNDAGAYALLGPSGCGKSTLLNIISGLIIPTRGRVLFEDRDVTALSPQQRNIAQVFQFPVIYDTMTVFDNLAFPLRNRGWKELDIRKRVHEVAELLELNSDLKFRASGLSADAKQKISLGRGLVRRDVAAVLFDEPLTVIDPHLKWLLRRKLKQIHQQLKLSLIYVTHDQTEALTFADQVVVMMQGEIVQIGTPQELFETPAHTFVGHFIGNPGMNLLKCEIQDNVVAIDDQSLKIEASLLRRAQSQGDSYRLGIRPEFIKCSQEFSHDDTLHQLQAQIKRVQPMGTHTILDAFVGNHRLWIKDIDNSSAVVGPTWLQFARERTLLYANERRVI